MHNSYYTSKKCGKYIVHLLRKMCPVILRDGVGNFRTVNRWLLRKRGLGVASVRQVLHISKPGEAEYNGLGPAVREWE